MLPTEWQPRLLRIRQLPIDFTSFAALPHLPKTAHDAEFQVVCPQSPSLGRPTGDECVPVRPRDTRRDRAFGIGGAMNNRPAAFDAQAATFDRRAGLSEQHCQAIAQAVLRLAAAMPGDLVFEIGAGTGMLGTWLARPLLRYVGLDLSRAMLAAFHRRLSSPSPMSLLLQADGDHRWPLADGAVRVIFSSRAVHLLDLAHVVDESFRVAQPDGASLIIGRIQRPPGSLPTMLQQAMQRLLRQQGFSSHAGEQHQRQLLATFMQRGGTVLEPVVVVRRTVTRTPWQSIRGLAIETRTSWT